MDDNRVGSARDGNDSTGLSRLAAGKNSNSGITLLSTIVPTIVFAAVCIIIFIVLRRKCHRIYAPRAHLKTVNAHERSAPLPGGWFDWIRPFGRIQDTFVLNHSSLDGYLFLRYLRVLGTITVVGVLLLWPILLPLHATGGAGNKELDMLTMGNVADGRKLYAHIVLAWVYFTFILYMVSRECMFYINLRQAYLLSPYYANRLSSRTVLYMNVPVQYLDEQRLRHILGRAVKRIWIPRGTDELDNLVKEREQTAMRLEKAETRLIRMANASRSRALKKQAEDEKSDAHASPKLQRDVEVTSGSEEAKSVQVDESSRSSPPTSFFGPERPLPDVNGSVASQWITHSSRPHHRPIANYGRRVDTIKWTRNQIKKLNWRIKKLRLQLLSKPSSVMHSAFVEFETHTDAQDALQSLTHHQPLHMSQRILGVRPFEIVWSSLSMSWWHRIVRKFSIRALIVAMIIFWSIPCALVGTISNIEYLSSKVPFLGWIADLPEAIKGVLTGALPAIALHLLMSIVPGILRNLARIAGTPTLTLIELYVQHAYFAFQVVQVFLVTTLTSAASAAVTQLIDNPMLARDLLSQNLPKASNFYLNYFLIQSLAIGAVSLVQFFNLIQLQVFAKFSRDPRWLYRRYHRLQRVHWGAWFPIYTNLGVITITYSLIAPLILGFAAVGVIFLHAVYKYNLVYVYDSEIDTKGLVYPRALMQLLVGLYFAEICLVGLFSLRGAFVQVVLMAVLLVLTFLVHVSLHEAVSPLLTSLPKSLTVEESTPFIPGSHQYPVGHQDPARFAHLDLTQDEEDMEGPMDQGQSRALEGASNAADTLGEGFQTIMTKQFQKEFPEVNAGLGVVMRFCMRWIAPDPSVKSNFFLRWLHPEIFADYTSLRRLVPPDLPEPRYGEEVERDIYYPRQLTSPPPQLWIPRDPGGVSRQEVEHTSKMIPITDEFATLDERGRMDIDLDQPRAFFDIERLRY